MSLHLSRANVDGSAGSCACHRSVAIGTKRRQTMASTKVEHITHLSLSESQEPEEKRVHFSSAQGSRTATERRGTVSEGTSLHRKLSTDPEGRHYPHHGHRPHPRSYKRSYSFCCGDNRFTPHYKRRRVKEDIVLPTKFLLGGNITDPLNLNSLQDEEINRAVNAVTPESSPLPTPKHRKEEIEVLIPPNINDPLNLNANDNDEEYASKLISPGQPRRKRPRHRKKKRNSEEGTGVKDETVEVMKEENEGQGESVTNEEEIVKNISEEKEISDKEKDKVNKEKEKTNKVVEKEQSVSPVKKERNRSKALEKDIIVSPVIPQPGERKRSYSRNASLVYRHTAGEKTAGHKFPKRKPQQKISEQLPKFRDKDAKFQFGNYNRYYGYRNPNNEEDHRLKYFKKEWLHEKDVLDIGCNIGHVTLSIARNCQPRRIIGIDIDRSLIQIAKKNVKYYVNCEPAESDSKFPVSMPILYGPLEVSGVGKSDGAFPKFPKNVSFMQGNYVLESDELLETVQPEFDVILCLSVTKWVHLNWGDDGLKRTFKRMFAQLRPGGRLILEAQGWASYKNKKKLTEAIYRNYHSITLHPEKFTEYLLSEVGFSTCEVIATPPHHSHGFQRPIQVFRKGEMSSAAPTPCVTASTPGSVDTALTSSQVNSTTPASQNIEPESPQDNKSPG